MVLWGSSRLLLCPSKCQQRISGQSCYRPLRVSNDRARNRLLRCGDVSALALPATQVLAETSSRLLSKREKYLPSHITFWIVVIVTTSSEVLAAAHRRLGWSVDEYFILVWIRVHPSIESRLYLAIGIRRELARIFHLLAEPFRRSQKRTAPELASTKQGNATHNRNRLHLFAAVMSVCTLKHPIEN